MLATTGLNLLFVGCVLCLNGLFLLNRIKKDEIIFINLFIGAVAFLVAYAAIFGADSNAQTVKSGAFTLMFSCTYLWVAFNQYNQTEGTGLGWYSLFLAITAFFNTTNSFANANTLAEVWISYSWALWVLLWSIYFVHLVLKRLSAFILGYLTILTGIFSAWVPGYLLLIGIL